MPTYEKKDDTTVEVTTEVSKDALLTEEARQVRKIAKAEAKLVKIREQLILLE